MPPFSYLFASSFPTCYDSGMEYVTLGNNKTSNIALGCMRIADKTEKEAERLIITALEGGVNLFDHADIYGGGRSEEIFGNVLKMNPALKRHMYIQSKCGIRQGYYDFSYDHIVKSVDGILGRLGIEKLDNLILHRPDILAEPDEISRALQILKESGKVDSFGVSNMNPSQIELLESWTGEKFTCNQMQLSLMHAGIVSSGINVNVENNDGTMYDGALLPYIQKRGMVLQAWSPFQYGMFEGSFLGNDKFPDINRKLNELSEKYNSKPSAIAASWILRIPGQMQVVLGTTDEKHLKDALMAQNIKLTRKEWYELYTISGHMLP